MLWCGRNLPSSTYKWGCGTSMGFRFDKVQAPVSLQTGCGADATAALRQLSPNELLQPGLATPPLTQNTTRPYLYHP